MALIVDVTDVEGAMIAVRIQKETNQGQFNDCMYFTPDEYNALTKAQIRDMAIARKDAWIQFVKDASKNVYVPTKADKIEAATNICDNFEKQLDQVLADPDIRRAECRLFKDRLQLDIDKLNAKIAELQA